MLILPIYDPQDDMFLSLIHVALKIRGYMMATPDHQGFSVREDQAIPFIPESIYVTENYRCWSRGLRRRQ